VLAEPDALPGAEVELAVRHGHRQVGPQEAGLHVGGHVVGTFAGVPEGHVLGHDTVEHHLHVVPHVGVPVLVDGEAGRGVEQLNMHETHRKLRQLGQPSENLLGDQVDAPVLGAQVDLPLEPRVRPHYKAGTVR